MSSNISKVNDVGRGTCSVGHADVPAGSPKNFINQLITGAQTVFLNNQPIAFVTSVGRTDCGHHTIAVGGSDSKVYAENQLVHRLNDVGVIIEGSGIYHMISGSKDTFN